MWHYILSFAVILFVFLGVIIGKSVLKNNQEQVYNSFYTQSIADGKLEREEIKKLLQNLPTNMDRELNKIGAMCYSVAGPPTEIDYVCPVCGEKTRYAATAEDQKNSEIIWEVNSNLPECRRWVSQVKGIKVELDERQFCKKCKPGIRRPVLILNLKIPGEKTKNRIEKIHSHKIKLLAEFTQGKVISTSPNDAETMLIESKSILEEMFKISPEEK